MRSQRNVLLSVLALVAASTAVAQSNGTLRWRSGATPLGLQPGAAPLQPQCGPISLACASSTTVPLDGSPGAPRSISLQLGAIEGSSSLKMARTQGLSLAVVGKAGFFSDLGVYGRVGTVTGRGNGLALMPGNVEGGFTYGIGLSWDFSRSASAVLGFDSYDFRGASGELRDVRSTSLGLQWRY